MVYLVLSNQTGKEYKQTLIIGEALFTLHPSHKATDDRHPSFDKRMISLSLRERV